MTEAAFQAARKVMQSANYLRGMITVQKGNVAKWTKIEAVHRAELNEPKADGAKKMLDGAMLKLKHFREKFAALKFPDNDLVVKVETKFCEYCDAKLETTKDGNCLSCGYKS